MNVIQLFFNKNWKYFSSKFLSLLPFSAFCNSAILALLHHCNIAEIQHLELWEHRYWCFNMKHWQRRKNSFLPLNSETLYTSQAFPTFPNGYSSSNDHFNFSVLCFFQAIKHFWLKDSVVPLPAWHVSIWQTADGRIL